MRPCPPTCASSPSCKSPSRMGRSLLIPSVRRTSGMYGIQRMLSHNGYEQRRQAALAEVQSTKVKAAATASAIALVQIKLTPGQSTDGAVFFPHDGKPLTGGHIVVNTNTDTFEFKAE